jgi:hypothetical protein
MDHDFYSHEEFMDKFGLCFRIEPQTLTVNFVAFEKEAKRSAIKNKIKEFFLSIDRNNSDLIIGFTDFLLEDPVMIPTKFIFSNTEHIKIFFNHMLEYINNSQNKYFGSIKLKKPAIQESEYIGINNSNESCASYLSGYNAGYEKAQEESKKSFEDIYQSIYDKIYNKVYQEAYHKALQDAYQKKEEINKANQDEFKKFE